MGDPCTLMMTQESRFAYPQNQAGLISNRTTNRACLQTKKQLWPETHILTGELSKLMIPRTCSLHT